MKHTPREPALTPAEYNKASRDSGWDSPKRAQELVANYLHAGTVVLDIGIGTGQAVEGYADKDVKVIGLDHDTSMLEAAQAVAGPTGCMIKGDINKPLPLGIFKEKIDIVQAIGVLEFATNLERVFDQIQTLLKPGGQFVFTIEASGNITDTQHFASEDITVYRHTFNEVRKLLHSKGLELIYDEAYDGYLRDTAANKRVPYHIFLTQKPMA